MITVFFLRNTILLDKSSHFYFLQLAVLLQTGSPPMGDKLQWKATSNGRLMFRRGNSEEILEEISSVALLSPACSFVLLPALAELCKFVGLCILC